MTNNDTPDTNATPMTPPTSPPLARPTPSFEAPADEVRPARRRPTMVAGVAGAVLGAGLIVGGGLAFAGADQPATTDTDTVTAVSSDGVSTDGVSTDGVSTDNAALPTPAASAETSSSGDGTLVVDAGGETGTMQPGGMPSGEMPSGEMPSGEMPSGGMPSGEMPGGPGHGPGGHGPGPVGQGSAVVESTQQSGTTGFQPPSGTGEPQGQSGAS